MSFFFIFPWIAWRILRHDSFWFSSFPVAIASPGIVIPMPPKRTRKVPWIICRWFRRACNGKIRQEDLEMFRHSSGHFKQFVLWNYSNNRLKSFGELFFSDLVLYLWICWWENLKLFNSRIWGFGDVSRPQRPHIFYFESPGYLKKSRNLMDHCQYQD